MFQTMDRVLCLIIVLNLCCYVFADDPARDENIDRGSRSDQAGLWFGPRLGKRSMRSEDDNRQTFLRLLEAADALKFYYDQLSYAAQDEPENKVAKKIIFTPKLGRSLKYDDEKRYESVDFTPRLGRRLTEEIRVTPADRDVYRSDPDQIDNRSKYFSPRLGRTMNLTPRLGRELAYEFYPEKVRVVRSANKTKVT